VNGFEERAVVVTGATGELGRAVTAAFLDAGAHVAAPYRSEERAAALRAHIPDADERLLLVRVDLADENAMRTFADDVVGRWGRIDALAALAGGTAGGEVLETGIEAFHSLFDQNLATALVSIRAVLPHMRARGYGRIVCVGARAALRGAKGMAAYSTAKAGVVRLVEALAEEVKEDGITANAVVPSIIDHPENRRRYPKADPRKWVSPAELAAVIRFLCSSDSSGVTGAAIPVFGRS
jgi:NAD(P)-dependent dehydrogenase (short-subunit alcohol dehydrogenase family)